MAEGLSGGELGEELRRRIDWLAFAFIWVTCKLGRGHEPKVGAEARGWLRTEEECGFGPGAEVG